MFYQFELLFTVLLIFTSIAAQDTCSNKEESECNALTECVFYWSSCHNIAGACSLFSSDQPGCNMKSECFFYGGNTCADRSATCSSFGNSEDICKNNGLIKCIVYEVFDFFYLFICLLRLVILGFVGIFHASRY
jgi:hypothetical protein